ncbi:MAG: DUF4345 domain-containing protein [Rhodospirillaceae bacterium]
MLEKRLLQIAVTTGCLVPLVGGALGIWRGPAMVSGAPVGDLDSHFRYLSGLLLGIGLGYVSTIRGIESRGTRFQMLTAIVVIGGLGRLISLIAVGAPSTSMTAALVMELAVTPALALWQHRVARRHFGDTSRNN